MRLVAIEEHWMLPELTDALRAVATVDASLAFNDLDDNQELLGDVGEGRIVGMDAQGIDLAVIALTPPGTQPLPDDDAVRLSRRANDVAADAVRAHPTRLRALSTLPMATPEAVPAELERAAALGHVGTMVYGRSGDRFLDDPAYDDFFAAAAALGQPVFLHPQLPSAAVRDAAYRGFDELTDLGLATFGWGWHVDAATAALRLILRGTFDRHPDLQLVLGHWGELLAFWLDRVDSLSRPAGLDRKVSEYFRTNIHLTTSGMLDPALLAYALSVTGPDRLIFSTDHPFQRPTAAEIATFLDAFDDPADREKFAHGNATALFGLDAG